MAKAPVTPKPRVTIGEAALTELMWGTASVNELLDELNKTAVDVDAAAFGLPIHDRQLEVRLANVVRCWVQRCRETTAARMGLPLPESLNLPREPEWGFTDDDFEAEPEKTVEEQPKAPLGEHEGTW